MVKPTQPKGIKPKAELTETSDNEGSTALSGQKLIIIITLLTIIICILFIGGNYFIINTIFDSKMSSFIKQTAHEEEEGEEGDYERPQKGIILDLGEFILNLSNSDAKRYLKVNVALELSRADHDPDLSAHSDDGGHGGHGGGGEDPVKLIEAEMNQYKPAIRDAIISVLSSKTTEELSSLAGKELSKEQITEAINPLFMGEREIIRVSFGTFIIQ